MTSRANGFVEALEGRSLLSSVLPMTEADESVLGGHAGHQITPSGYSYPPPSGGGGGGGGSNTSGRASAKNAKAFLAKLRGTNEVPRRTTSAKGQAAFQVVNKGRALKFHLQVSKISNVVAAHLHLGRAKQNGEVVAFLFGPVSPGGGPRSGVIAQGRLTAGSLTGPLDGVPFSRLLREIRAGNVYVNVHTDNGVGASDTGRGDFASGEIRGQVGVAPKRK